MAAVEYRKHDAVAEIRLNRPGKLNAINGEMLDGLSAALDRAEADDSVCVVLLAGEGRAFSAGFDLDIGRPPEGKTLQQHTAHELRRDFELIMRFHDCPKPTIAAVHGYCLGSSMEISAVCDITIASEDCKFGAPEVSFGSGIVCLVLPWVIGLKNAKELLLTGDAKVPAGRARDMGLVNRVVPAGQQFDEAMAVARQVAANDARAVQMTKRAMNRGLDIAGFRAALEQALETDIDIETGGESGDNGIQ